MQKKEKYIYSLSFSFSASTWGVESVILNASLIWIHDSVRSNHFTHTLYRLNGISWYKQTRYFRRLQFIVLLTRMVSRSTQLRANQTMTKSKLFLF